MVKFTKIYWKILLFEKLTNRLTKNNKKDNM